ncbi:unnamed protein product [Effrenium voratum]|nr:unnamed protein product [Effrenium voratum]|mmetsp:Transcript_15631/g.37048  ORF Transcript_15631/g.37048 Transcript_15631/m.37048 type:complete len:317 (+) Transcript_15631:80-1030(+)
MGHTDVLPFLLGERKRESAKPAEICIAPCDKAAEPSPCSSHSTEVGENKLRDFSRANSFESEEPLSYLSKEAALQLQQGLLAAYTSAGFQKRLHEMSRKFKAQRVDPHLSADFKLLVRTQQFQILPLYGFDPSEQGVEDMLQAFEEFKDDPDIYVNASAIQEAIFSPWQESHPKAIESIGFARKPGTKVTIMEMLQSLLISFSEPHFQEEIAKLKLDYDALAGRCTFANLSQKVSVPDPQGYYHLPGRAELALQLQQPVLTCFGFSPTRGGVCDMVRHCVPYLSDLAVAELFDNINMKLGMSRSAAERFRHLACSL